MFKIVSRETIYRKKYALMAKNPFYFVRHCDILTIYNMIYKGAFQNPLTAAQDAHKSAFSDK